jgi:Fe-S cluster assembly iron-binding protein IscA
MTMRIDISDSAAKYLHSIMTTEHSLLLVGEGECYTCSSGGVGLFLTDEAPSESDITGSTKGVKWYCSEKERTAIDGIEIDFKKDDKGTYFRVCQYGHYFAIPTEYLHYQELK